MTVDLVVIGLGSAGRSAVELATELGASVVGIDRARVGGDCLWSGCIPSKTLIASARVAHTMRSAARFGIEPVEPVVDLRAIWSRIADTQRNIAATDDDPDRLRALGAEIVFGDARITADHEVTVGDRVIRAESVLVTTGSTPGLPDVPGLETAGGLTTDGLFDGKSPFSSGRPPKSVVVLGAGPTGCELSQALRRLGVAVALLEAAPSILAREEASLVDRVRQRLLDEHVDVVENVVLDAVTRAEGETVLWTRVHGEPREFVGEELLVTTGRRPALGGLGLAERGVELGPHGVVVDDAGRSTVGWIWAAGDCAGTEQSTHWAASAATVAVRAALLPGRPAVESVVPRSTFVDPELASVGLTSAAARSVHGDEAVEVWSLDLAEVDRARTDGTTGAIVLVTAGRQHLVGAHVLAPGAGEVIGELTLAIRDGRRLNHLAGLLHAYPTISSGIGTIAARAVRAKAARIGAAARRRRGSS